jgi:hypothetical protein
MSFIYKYLRVSDSKISISKSNNRQSHKNSICSSRTSHRKLHSTEENSVKVWIFLWTKHKAAMYCSDSELPFQNLVPFFGMKRRPSFSALFSGRKSHTAPPASGSCLPSGALAAASQSLARAGPGI